MDNLNLKTKYFGEVEVKMGKEGVHANFEVIYNGQEISFELFEYGIYGDKLNLCWEIIDKYEKINKIAKNAIIEFFNKDENVTEYFECLFEDERLTEKEINEVFGVKSFKKLDIKNVVEKMENQNFIFEIEDGVIKFTVDYTASKKYSPCLVLCVNMDEKLNIIDFEMEDIS